MGAWKQISPTPLAVRMEKEPQSQGMLVGSRSWWREEKGFSPRDHSLQKDHSPAKRLILAQWYPFLTNNLWNCEMTNLHYFQPLSLQNFNTPLTGNEITCIIEVTHSATPSSFLLLWPKVIDHPWVRDIPPTLFPVPSHMLYMTMATLQYCDR